MSDQIKTALVHLDPENEDHWTADGRPRMDAVQRLLGDETITRAMVTNADPDFTREKLAESRKDAEQQAGDQPQRAAEQAGDQPQKAADQSKEASELAAAATEQQGLANDDDQEAQPAEAVSGVLDMTIVQVCSSMENMDAWQSAANALLSDLIKERDALNERINNISRVSAAVTVQQERQRQREPNADTADVRAYLARQKQVREERAARAQGLRDSGIDPAELAKLVNSGSKLDTAMRQRKPARGSTRPEFTPRDPQSEG